MSVPATDVLMRTGPRSLEAIAVENIVKRYGDFEAVKGVSFAVAEGEIFGLLGPNGAGKSTLIRMMTTLIPLSAGRAIVEGHDVAREPDEVRRSIGVIPQALTSDPDRLARFMREAQVLASLNHPNIAAIHHVEETAAGPALVMELRSLVVWFTIRGSFSSMNPRRDWIRCRASRYGKC